MAMRTIICTSPVIPGIAFEKWLVRGRSQLHNIRHPLPVLVREVAYDVIAFLGDTGTIAR